MDQIEPTLHGTTLSQIISMLNFAFLGSRRVVPTLGAPTPPNTNVTGMCHDKVPVLFEVHYDCRGATLFRTHSGIDCNGSSSQYVSSLLSRGMVLIA